MRAAVSCNDVDAALTVLRRASRDVGAVSARMQDSALLLLAQAGRLDDAMATLADMAAAGGTPSHEAFTALITLSRREGKYAMATDLYNRYALVHDAPRVAALQEALRCVPHVTDDPAALAARLVLIASAKGCRATAAVHAHAVWLCTRSSSGARHAYKVLEQAVQTRAASSACFALALQAAPAWCGVGDAATAPAAPAAASSVLLLVQSVHDTLQRAVQAKVADALVHTAALQALARAAAAVPAVADMASTAAPAAPAPAEPHTEPDAATLLQHVAAEVVQVWTGMTRRRLRPTHSDAYEAALWALTRGAASASWQARALAVLDDLQGHAGTAAAAATDTRAPYAVTTSAVDGADAEPPAFAAALATSVSDMRVTPRALELGVRAAAQAGRWRRALELLAEVEAAGVAPSVAALLPALHVCAAEGRMKHVVQLLGKLEEAVAHGVAAHRSTPGDGADCGVASGTSAAVEQLRSGYGAALRGCERAKRARVALQLLDRMRDAGMQPGAEELAAACAACGAAGHAHAAGALLSMARSACPPAAAAAAATTTAATAAAALEAAYAGVALAQGRDTVEGRLAVLPQLLRDAARDGVMGARVVEAALSACARSQVARAQPDDRDDVARAGSEASAEGLETDEEAEAARAAEEAGSAPGAAAPHADPACTTDAASAALQLLATAQELGAPPSAAAQSLAIVALCRARRDAEALQLLRSMHAQGRVPTFNAANALLSAAARGADLRAAQQLLRDLAAAGVRLNAHLYAAAISACTRAAEAAAGGHAAAAAAATALRLLDEAVAARQGGEAAYAAAALAQCASPGGAAAAARVLDRMRAAGLMPRAELLAAVQRASGGDSSGGAA